MQRNSRRRIRSERRGHSHRRIWSDRRAVDAIPLPLFSNDPPPPVMHAPFPAP